MAAINNTTRFSDRVEDYVKYRPHYPKAIIPLLQEKYGLTSDKHIADVGAGTGISSSLFLDAGYRVTAIEPNKEMREKALALLGKNQKLDMIDGAAEHTTIVAHTIDVIVAGQAFHWFDREKAKIEFKRILRKGGKVVLLWNERLTASPFEEAYDRLIIKHGVDYVQVDHRNIDENKIRNFFEPGEVLLEILPNWQIFDFDGLKGRLLSSSYIPTYGSAGYPAMIADLKRLFDQYQQEGKIRINYETKLFIGAFQH
ncbi:class I SAM-dependent methyltransferase [Olivibacter ginsenosidimutans]|uniref:Class I SAM-dependent methyltransferase n=1 Tax=Olivibacter ginsenosidimutans TaxID=1176537 RepID=A0ABP9CF58_9SPHI